MIGDLKLGICPLIILVACPKHGLPECRYIKISIFDIELNPENMHSCEIFEQILLGSVPVWWKIDLNDKYCS